MAITDVCIKRPVFATVLNLLVILLGIIAFERLTVREYPKVDEPVVTVETVYPGANADIIESQVTNPLEESLAGLEGIDVMSSISRQEMSQITMRFKLTRDPDAAAADVRDRVGRVRDQLPIEVHEPIIAKVEADADPIIYMAFYSDRHSPMEITDYADRQVKDRIQNIEGVSSAKIFGERKISMRIWLKPERLAAYGLTPQDIENALRAQNVDIPSGLIESTGREFTVLSEMNLQTPEQFNNIIVKREGDRLVRLRDVGYAEIAPKSERVSARFNGKEAVAIGVIKQSTANPLQVSKGLKELLPDIKKTLPEGMQIEIAYDSSIFIDRSIRAVFKTLLEAVVLVILVIFLFLRNIRSTLIPLVAIPVSIIGAFLMIYIFDFSINTLTLLALVLAIGLVVDDAIVVLENIYRHLEEGMSRMEAALKGAKEIVFAIIVMTLTLAAVYTPIAFMQERTGRLFREFALTLAGAVLISGFVALTLSPMMCSKLLTYTKRHGRVYNSFEKGFDWIYHLYRELLDWSLLHRKLVVIIGVIVSALGVWLYTVLPRELTPTEDQGFVIGIALAPEGSSIDYTTKWMKKMEPIYNAVPEVEKFFLVGGFPVVSQGVSFVALKDWDERDRKQQDIVKLLQPQLFAGIPGIMAFPVNPPSLGNKGNFNPVEFVVQTTGSYEELNMFIEKLMAEAKKWGGLINVDTDLKLNKPQIDVTIKRDKAAAANVDVEAVGRALETMMGGRQVTRFNREGKQYDVIVKIEDVLRTTPTAISDIYVRGRDNKMIKLDNLVDLKETVAPKELNHFNQMRAAKLTASIAPGYTLGDALAFLDSTADKILEPSMQTDYDGESREFKKSGASVAITFALALCFIYLVLSAQFESFISPLVIMLTVPLSVTGALLALYLTGGTLNIYSQIGLITLIGLITKHGILIIEFANQQEAQGTPIMEAIRRSCHLRLRPILMTTASTALGAIPLAIAYGAGAESRKQIGWTVIGGMLVGTLFSLFVIPIIYSMVRGAKANKEELKTTEG